ncbi:HvfC family RiPP maturation protein [Paraglaciecola hydrolytica]|uniref:Uncharacterized protein n=1 Tax=Paraglaciecola hydrolytica TaxID=1799789 RepID=A0A148KLI6_9ALTE|nr:putative DNA-binding domain-containing protein [Paraglaciecola hydrolytica]KXI27176.1 hypothetical protein AX660_01970 [Paraglaciecola hydrolytica]
MDFQNIQHHFVAHLKDPEQHPFELGSDQVIEERRLSIYRELFFNNILGFLSSGFPVLESLYNTNEWRRLARQFMASHHCRSPYFIDISLEFVEFLSEEYELKPNDPPFLKELAHYEWLELSVSIRKTEQDIVLWDGQSEVKAVQFSPLASLVSYHYPVHQVSPEFQPQQQGEAVYLVVCRDKQDEVNFVLLNPLTAHLLDIIQQQESININELHDVLAPILPQLSLVQLDSALSEIIQQMLTKEILLPCAES